MIFLLIWDKHTIKMIKCFKKTIKCGNIASPYIEGYSSIIY